MKKHYILIDYENVQTKSLAVLQGAPNQAFRIMVFVGANQSKIPIDLVSSMQELRGQGRVHPDHRKRAKRTRLSHRLLSRSADRTRSGRHLSRHFQGHRLRPVDQAFEGDKRSLRRGRRTCSTSRGCRRPTRNPQNEQLSAIVENLSARGNSRPRKVKTLKNSINSLFGNKLEPDKIDSLVKDLQEQKYIVIKQENVAYHNM